MYNPSQQPQRGRESGRHPTESGYNTETGSNDIIAGVERSIMSNNIGINESEFEIDSENVTSSARSPSPGIEPVPESFTDEEIQPQPVLPRDIEGTEQTHEDPLEAYLVRSNTEARREELLNTAVDAIHVQLDSSTGDQRNKKQKRAVILCIVVSILIVGGALAAVLTTQVYSNSSSQDETGIADEQVPSEIFSLIPTSQPSMIPSVEFSSSPSLSLAPTTERFAEVVSAIATLIGPDPENSFMVEALEEKSSSQYRAALWLAEEDAYFDNFTFATFAQLIEFAQRYSAVVLYYATGGEDSWIDKCNFLSPSSHICEWHNPVKPGGAAEQYSVGFPKLSGVAYCLEDFNFGDGFASLALGIQMAANNMTGTIPPEMFTFVYMEYLRFPINSLSGTIPSTLYYLDGLKQLSLPLNKLHGSIDRRIGNLEALLLVSFGNNVLTGTIPSEVGILSNLQSINLSNNRLTSAIPEEIANAAKLMYLDWNNNTLSGPIPHNLTDLTNLNVLALGDNKNLTWVLPNDIGSKFPNLIALGLSGVKLDGTIPDSLGNLTNLERINLDETGLTGSIPPAISSLSNLEVFYAPYNALNGTIPSSMGNLSNLELLDLTSNQLTGQLPEELGEVTNMTLFSVVSNQLTGTIPTNYLHMESLDRFAIQFNYLTGNMNFLCNAFTKLLAYADCDGEITCDCCYLCCDEFDVCDFTE